MPRARKHAQPEPEPTAEEARIIITIEIAAGRTQGYAAATIVTLGDVTDQDTAQISHDLTPEFKRFARAVGKRLGARIEQGVSFVLHRQAQPFEAEPSSFMPRTAGRA